MPEDFSFDDEMDEDFLKTVEDWPAEDLDDLDKDYLIDDELFTDLDFEESDFMSGLELLSDDFDLEVEEFEELLL